jgi:hypothetical protein
MAIADCHFAALLLDFPTLALLTLLFATHLILGVWHSACNISRRDGQATDRIRQPNEPLFRRHLHFVYGNCVVLRVAAVAEVLSLSRLQSRSMFGAGEGGDTVVTSLGSHSLQTESASQPSVEPTASVSDHVRCLVCSAGFCYKCGKHIYTEGQGNCEPWDSLEFFTRYCQGHKPDALPVRLTESESVDFGDQLRVMLAE